jgi:hypothetical protein
MGGGSECARSQEPSGKMRFRSLNEAASGNGAITVPFHVRHPRRTVPEQHRWPLNP